MAGAKPLRSVLVVALLTIWALLPVGAPASVAAQTAPARVWQLKAGYPQINPGNCPNNAYVPPCYFARSVSMQASPTVVTFVVEDPAPGFDMHLTYRFTFGAMPSTLVPGEPVEVPATGQVTGTTTVGWQVYMRWTCGGVCLSVGSKPPGRDTVGVNVPDGRPKRGVSVNDAVIFLVTAPGAQSNSELTVSLGATNGGWGVEVLRWVYGPGPAQKLEGDPTLSGSTGDQSGRSVPTTDQLLTNHLASVCPQGSGFNWFDLYARLRGRQAQGTLMSNPDDSLVFSYSDRPRSSIIDGFISKLGQAAGFEDDPSSLGWLLTENGTPRYPDNPYVQVTRDAHNAQFPRDDGGTFQLYVPSYESEVANRIANSGGNLSPADVLGMALDVTNGDYPLATLTVHNLFKELSYTNREATGGGRALLGWNRDNRGTQVNALTLDRPQDYGYDVRSPAQVQAIIGKLGTLRPSGDLSTDKMGPWYHLYGVLFLGSVTTGLEATLGATAENLSRYWGIIEQQLGLDGSLPDAGKQAVNSCAGVLASYIAALPPPPVPAAPAPP